MDFMHSLLNRPFAVGESGQHQEKMGQLKLEDIVQATGGSILRDASEVYRSFH